MKKSEDGAWRLLRNGEPVPVRGLAMGRSGRLDLAASIGANVYRTYHSPADGEAHARARATMDEAYAKGLLCISGLPLRGEGKGFSYSNREQVLAQRERVRAEVAAWRDHPGILIWGLGNEAEGTSTRVAHPEFWTELEELARIVKETDPHRPMMTIVAWLHDWKAEAIRKYYPSLDILGVNTYGGALKLSAQLDRCGWEKPFILTEFGPLGHWEVSRTDWDEPVEQSSEEKGEFYAKAFAAISGDRRSLGAVAFVWGQKQETTATWYGMFLKSGEKTPAVDYMAHAYGGEWPANRSPRIRSMSSELAMKRVPPGAVFTAAVEAEDREGDPLSYEWLVVRERLVRWGGGALEPVPPVIEGCILEDGAGDGQARRATVSVKTPDKPGAYRLFVYVRDGQGGGATQNIPFFVSEPGPARPVADDAGGRDGNQ